MAFELTQATIEALYEADLKQIEADRLASMQEARRLRDMRLEQLELTKVTGDEPCP